MRQHQDVLGRYQRLTLATETVTAALEDLPCFTYLYISDISVQGITGVKQKVGICKMSGTASA